MDLAAPLGQPDQSLQPAPQDLAAQPDPEGLAAQRHRRHPTKDAGPVPPASPPAAAAPSADGSASGRFWSFINPDLSHRQAPHKPRHRLPRTSHPLRYLPNAQTPPVQIPHHLTPHSQPRRRPHILPPMLRIYAKPVPALVPKHPIRPTPVPPCPRNTLRSLHPHNRAMRVPHPVHRPSPNPAPIRLNKPLPPTPIRYQTE